MEKVSLEKGIKWVTFEGSPSSGKVTSRESLLGEISRVITGGKGDLRKLAFRDPSSFKAGEIHHHLPMWEEVLAKNPRKEEILGWLEGGVNIHSFMRPFKGNFKGKKYDSPSPPRKIFKNHPSCAKFTEFITKTLLERIATGAVRIWGRVGKVTPPWLVLPMTVEPNKPRLCVDARFLNLWMMDTPFHLDTLVSVPRIVYQGSHFSKIDDKSGYDHILLSQDSQEYFGVEWQGWWLVGTTLPFGWKNSPFVYQTVGLGPTSYFRELGITCALYIDDRLVGELFTDDGYWSRPIDSRVRPFSREAAEAALFVVCLVLVKLGYFLGLNKCVLIPTTRLVFLGLIIDSVEQAFLVPQEKREKFASLRDLILSYQSSIPLRSIQRLMGKCNSFSLAFPGAKFYIREMAAAIGQAGRGCDVIFSRCLREEIEFWKFLDHWESCIPWWQEKHVALNLSTDASAFRWAASVHLQSGNLEIGDYWSPELLSQHINVKEMYAVLKSIEALPACVKNCRLDIAVDNQITLNAWQGRAPRSPALSKVARLLFQEVTARNLMLRLSYVPSQCNLADGFSRQLSRSDAKLSPRCWNIVEVTFGGPRGHTLDLMALDSNTQCDRNGVPLRHFTPFASPDSAGINVFSQDLTVCDGTAVNAYVFPPFDLISPLLRFIRSEKATVTMVVPQLSPLPYWWPVINAMSSGKILVATKGTTDALLFPSKLGFQYERIQFNLWAFRIGRCF